MYTPSGPFIASISFGFTEPSVIWSPAPITSPSLTCNFDTNGIVLKDAHTAMGDVRATKELLQLRLSQGLEVYHNHVTEQPDRPLRFMPHNTVAVLDKEDFK